MYARGGWWQWVRSALTAAWLGVVCTVAQGAEGEFLGLSFSGDGVTPGLSPGLLISLTLSGSDRVHTTDKFDPFRVGLGTC